MTYGDEDFISWMADQIEAEDAEEEEEEEGEHDN